ncbi:hypothetical protein LINPERPRIM_LOCUS17496, partial [Linum perenne]
TITREREKKFTSSSLPPKIAAPIFFRISTSPVGDSANPHRRSSPRWQERTPMTRAGTKRRCTEGGGSPAPVGEEPPSAAPIHWARTEVPTGFNVAASQNMQKPLEELFFPIYDSMHFNLFVVNRRDNRYEFLDSKYPDALDTKWRATSDRVMKYAIAYFQTYCGADQLKDYQWYSMEDVLQRRRTNECGIYILNLVEAWEGKVEEYMVNKWKFVATTVVIQSV